MMYFALCLNLVSYFCSSTLSTRDLAPFLLLDQVFDVYLCIIEVFHLLSI